MKFFACFNFIFIIVKMYGEEAHLVPYKCIKCLSILERKRYSLEKNLGYLSFDEIPEGHFQNRFSIWNI